MRIDISTVCQLIYIISSLSALARWVRKARKRWKVENISVLRKLHQFWSADKFLAILIILAISFWFLSLYFFIAKPNWQFITFPPKVYEPFHSLYAKYKPKLGEPIASVQNADHVYQAAYQNAMVIYFKSFNTFYRLDNTFRWTKYAESDWEASPWQNETWLREHFSPPEGLLPPYAGVAKHWKNDPKAWTWIGGRKWDCYFLSGVPYQEFQHGIITGNFLLNPAMEVAGNIYILFDDFSWEAIEGKLQNNPVCIPAPYK